MTGRRGGGGRERPRAASPSARLASIILAVTAAGLVPAGLVPAGLAADSKAPVQPVVPEAAAMAGTEDYCTGYGRTFHGEWEAGEGGDGAGGAPAVLFRIGVSGDGSACYAQLNARTPPGVAPYEFPRFGATATGGSAWTLRYRNTVLEIDAGNGTAVRREGGNVARSGVLRARAPGRRRFPAATPRPGAEALARVVGGTLSGSAVSRGAPVLRRPRRGPREGPGYRCPS